MRRDLARRFRCPKCGAAPGVLCEGAGGPRRSSHAERNARAAEVMAETRAFLEAIGRYGATKQQLRARAVSLKPLDDALRRGWVEPHQYPELSGCYYRLTDEGLALLRKRTTGEAAAT